MPHVQSVVIEAIGYDESTKVLTVRLRADGRTLAYGNVPQHVYDSLMFADSISAYFKRHIEGVYLLRQTAPRKLAEPTRARAGRVPKQSHGPHWRKRTKSASSIRK